MIQQVEKSEVDVLAFPDNKKIKVALVQYFTWLEINIELTYFF